MPPRGTTERLSDPPAGRIPAKQGRSPPRRRHRTGVPGLPMPSTMEEEPPVPAARTRPFLILRRSAALLSAVLLSLGMSGVATAANPASATTTTNQELSVQVSTDATNDPVWLGTSVAASATANLGEGNSANVIYAVDVSGSMENPSFNPFQPSVGDCD